jgi:uncharacterized membrane protein YedE/YeeE
VRALVIALASGALFGAGLAWSGMADPHRVHSFLDVLGNWDPTLAFVMAGAIIPMAFAWKLRQRMAKPFADAAFNLPETTRVDARLAAGSIIFGIGWGLGGLCPGPGFAGLAIAPGNAALFTIAMLIGMALHRYTSAVR